MQISVNAATYTVITTNDSGAGSLRQAILDANAAAADDTINFNIANCPNGICTITLTSGELAINAASTAGKLTITNLTGASNLLISGNNQSRVFYVKGNANLTLDGVTVTGGNGTGTTNTGFNNYGGGIVTETTSSILTLTNSTVSGNSATQYGGGILNYGTLMLTNSTISNNSATVYYGGGIYTYNSTVTINNSTISGNTSPQGFGGGIMMDYGSLTMTNSTISNNLTKYDGGGIYNNSGTIAITNSTINGNVAIAQYGGGIRNSGGVVTLTNSTVSSNTANHSYGAGGGIHNGSTGTLNLNNVTVTGNKSSNASCTNCGGGVLNESGSTTNLLNTIIAGNTVANVTGSPDFYGAVSSTSSFNLIGNNQGTTGITNGTNNNQVGTNTSPINARLAPLSDYGGSTPTHALFLNSPAINNGTASGAPTADQRGAARVGAPDIGSFERGGIVISPAALPDGMTGVPYNQTLTANTSGVTFSIAAIPGQSLPAGLTLSPGGQISGTPTAGGGIFTVKAAINGFADAAQYVIAIPAPPVITAPSVSIPAGSNLFLPIATVNDYENSASGVTVTIIGANSSNGVTVSGIVNNNGTISANIATGCGATNASFTLQATNPGGLSSTATLNITLTANTAPNLVYPNTQTGQGNSLNISPTTAADNGSIASFAIVSVSPALTTAPTINTTNGVVSITNAQPVGSYVITIRATDNCGVSKDANFTLTVIAPMTFTVTNTLDGGTGSLRSAITAANSSASNDTVNFAIPTGSSGCTNGVCTITLTSGNLTINATSTAGKLTITNSTGANNLLIFGNNADRVFALNGADLTLNGVKVTGGSNSYGGGIYNYNGTATINNSIISGNAATYGGGIYNYLGNLTITDSTISGNSATQTSGAISNDSATLTMKNSTVEGNSAVAYGGIFNSGTITMSNSTVSNNSAQQFAGGITNIGTLNLTNVTVTGNRLSSTSNSQYYYSGGIVSFQSGSTANLLNTIIAGNTVANSISSPDFYGTVAASSSFNIIGNNQGTTGITNGTNNNQVGTNTSPIDARFAPLGNYGGTTQTHALLSNSPAIDAGSDCVINLTCSSNNPPAALTTDQRGTGFPRKVGSAVDIGAVEVIPSYTVSTPAGQNISVAPTSNLNLNFGNVTTAGNTVATVIPPDQLQPLPSGFTLFGSNLAYDITTSASFSGNITITFAVPNVADAATCGNLRSLHYENGAWTTNTNATPIYNVGTQVCTVAQTVSSLSPFVVVLQTPASFSYEADVSPRPGGDGFVDADDIQQIRLFSVGGGLPYQSNEFQRVDCSPRSTLGDGFLDSDDVQQARRYSVGTDGSQIAGGPSSGSVPFSIDSTISVIDETFDNTTLFTIGKSKRSPAFRIDGQINNADQTITVPVLIDATGKEAGYTFSLSYDAGMLSDPQVSIGSAGGDVVFNANTAGHIGFSVTSFSGETIAPGANQVLVNVTFTVAANAAAGTAAINFTDVLARRKASGVDPNSAITQPTYTGGNIRIDKAAGKRISE